MPPPSSSRPSAKRLAYDHIRAVVVNTPLDEAVFLTEGEVAEAVGISRTPVREAFLQLETERFLKLMPKKGAYIPVISERDMEEVIETRSIIEAYAARQLARFAEDSDSAMADAANLLSDQRAAGASSDGQAFIDLDREFHVTLVGGTGNGLLVELYESLRDRQVRMGNIAIFSSPSRFEQVVGEHEAILAAIREGNEELTVQAIAQHLETTLGVLRDRRGSGVGRRLPFQEAVGDR